MNYTDILRQLELISDSTRTRAEHSRYVIGIDPDIHLSGVAVLDTIDKTVDLMSLAYPALVVYVKEFVAARESTLVVVELDRNTTHVWHGQEVPNKELACYYGMSVGKCIQRGIDISDMLTSMGCKVREQRPLIKQWDGPDGKITDAEIRRLDYITINKKRSNQEERDALLIAMTHSNIPIRLCKEPR